MRRRRGEGMKDGQEGTTAQTLTRTKRQKEGEAGGGEGGGARKPKGRVGKGKRVSAQ